MTDAAADEFVREWIDAWNARDLERVLAHWADDCVFTSPFVVQWTGDPSGTVRGKAALRAYWKRGLELNQNLRFTLERTLVGHDSVVISYRNHRGQHCAEVIRLGADGKAVAGLAHYRDA
jgi:ketosteroid isomerase-like protein